MIRFFFFEKPITESHCKIQQTLHACHNVENGTQMKLSFRIIITESYYYTARLILDMSF